MTPRATLAALAVALGCAACGSTTYYEWGRYEDSVFKVTATPDGFDLAEEIASLEEQIQESVAKERPIPPGLHAHVGYLQSIAGDLAAARDHFEMERTLYPESARFIDHLEARLAPGT